MAWHDVERDFRRVREDVSRVYEDTRHLEADLERQASLAGDELLTAEYLATEGVLEWLSAWQEDGRALSRVALRQWRHAFDDGLRSVEALLASRSASEALAVPRAHVERRLEHLGEGVRDAAYLFGRSLARTVEPLSSVWRPFREMVRRDWS